MGFHTQKLEFKQGNRKIKKSQKNFKMIIGGNTEMRTEYKVEMLSIAKPRLSANKDVEIFIN